MLPQLNGSLGYTRTLATEFSSITSGTDTTTAPPLPEGCTQFFEPDPSLPLTARVDSLEKALQCSTNTSPFAAFRDLPFGRLNQYSIGLTASQTLFAGGRLWAQKSAAGAARSAAEIVLSSSRAQLALDVTQAYYDALLSERLLTITETQLRQAERTLEQTRLAKQVGNKPEFDLLRAQVTAQNLRPTVIQRRSARDQAYMRLKQLLNVPMDSPLELATPLGDSLPTLPRAISRLVSTQPGAASIGDTATDQRAPVRQAVEAMNAQEQQLKVARAERFPSVVVSSQYGRVAYPSAGLPAWDQFRTNWTVGVSLQVPLFTGGQITGDQMIAKANLVEARARLQQTRELAALDTRSALDQLQAAQASWQASASTVQQASQAYQIAEIRYDEGISTQLELDDSRLMLHQAEANRATAARDLQLARIRVALLPYLPIGAGASTTQQTLQQNGTTTTTEQSRPSTTPQRATQGGTQAIQANRTGGND